MRYLSLGDTTDIAASCHYVDLGGTGVILDAGMDPDKDGYDALPPFELIKNQPVDHVVITHAHHDHLGSLPVLSHEVPHARVHMSRPTAMLAEVLLPSSARLQKRRVREGSTHTAPVFDVETAEALSYVYETHPLDTPFRLAGTKAEGDLVATFYHASHVLGAVGLLLDGDEVGPDGELERRRLFYTSDTSIQAQTILPGADFPDESVDVLLLESTLGADPDAAATTRKAEERRFGDAIGDGHRARRRRSRAGLRARPQPGRSRDDRPRQDARRHPARARPSTRRARCAPSPRSTTARARPARASTPTSRSSAWTRSASRARARARRRPSGSPASSSSRRACSSSGRRASTSPRRLVSDARHGIFFVGYSKEGSPGDRLQLAAAAGEQMIFDEQEGPIAVRATVERFRFSGHAHRDDLVGIVGRLDPETVVLVHGETAAKEWMRDTINEAYPDVRVVIPQQGVEIEL